MKLKKALAFITAAALTCCMTAAALNGVQARDENGILRVMPLGDSITDGFNIVGGYRTSLWKALEKDGYTDSIDFVGPNWGSVDNADPNHAGYSGYAIADIPGQRQGIYNFIDYLMENYPADVVMLQIGTNDILSSCTDGMGDRLELLVDAVLGYLPADGRLYLATIPYMDADVTTYTDAYTAEEMDAAVDAYNEEVRALVNKKQAQGKPIMLSDINSVLTKADLADGVHPSQDGYNKMGAYWHEKLLEYLNGTSDAPVTETTEAPTPEPTEAPETNAEESLFGDLNADAQLTLTDAVILQKYLLGVGELDRQFWKNADLNADQQVDVLDLVLLKRAILERRSQS